MDKKRAFMRAGYSLLFALLALVFNCVYETTQREPAERFALFSGQSVSAVSVVCLLVGVGAGGTAVFFLVRAFYMAFTRPELRQQYEDKGYPPTAPNGGPATPLANPGARRGHHR